MSHSWLLGRGRANRCLYRSDARSRPEDRLQLRELRRLQEEEGVLIVVYCMLQLRFDASAAVAPRQLPGGQKWEVRTTLNTRPRDHGTTHGSGSAFCPSQAGPAVSAADCAPT